MQQGPAADFRRGCEAASRLLPLCETASRRGHDQAAAGQFFFSLVIVCAFLLVFTYTSARSFFFASIRGIVP